jgi:hypothetical protein
LVEARHSYDRGRRLARNRRLVGADLKEFSKSGILRVSPFEVLE